MINVKLTTPQADNQVMHPVDVDVDVSDIDQSEWLYSNSRCILRQLFETIAAHASNWMIAAVAFTRMRCNLFIKGMIREKMPF